jgi:hypothetical protein
MLEAVIGALAAKVNNVRREGIPAIYRACPVLISGRRGLKRRPHT